MTTYPLKNSSSCELTRRLFTNGTTAVAGVAVLGLSPSLVFAQAMRTRMDIVTFAQDATRLANFEGAVKEMKDRSVADPNDPKGWLVVANAHRDFCAVPTQDPNQVHFCYWFLAWHRAYISVTERKIREISGDDSFSYPYWNWSSDRHIPQAYAKAGSSLANAVRFARTQPSGLQDDEVDFNPNDPSLKALGVSALSAKAFEAKTKAQISLSFGGIARPNSAGLNGAGAYGNNRLEGTPHGPVHVYVGGENGHGEPGDMTDFATAARDPIFFAHHGNLDRLWEIWRSDPKHKATEPQSSGFLNHRFVFAWLDGSTVDMPMSDVLDTTKLGYVYDSLKVLRAGAVGPVASAESASSRPAAVGRQVLDVPLQPQGAVGENGRQILEISDIEAPSRPMTVSVFIKPADAPINWASASGRFPRSSPAGKSPGRRKCCRSTSPPPRRNLLAQKSSSN